ncbi:MULTISPECIES: DUF3472 domain-containing protein [Rahnella]|uniref:DUF3472 domain-containing protein n=1 Tax=Rahnella TaxID=34037 RepID=UPI0010452663|nr:MULTISPECIES: DUF3472 domain-containing protein [Rahnella]TCQ84461.1 uncharacterized protein DUF3472 [Rahnella sp. JUb53]
MPSTNDRNKNETKEINEVPSWGPSLTSYFTKDKYELIYVEQMVPSMGDEISIYWSGCNFYFEERGGYSGIQHQNDKEIDGKIFTRNNICSIWDLDSLDPSLPSEVTLTYGLPGLHSSHFGGEGTGLHTSHPMPWTPNQWYAIVIRRWDNPVSSKTTGMAMFMYSYLDSKWTHYMSADVPGVRVPLTGNTCNSFLERFSGTAESYHGIYGQHFRMDEHGVWEKPFKYVASAGGRPEIWDAELYQDANVKLSVGKSNNQSTTITLNPNQWDSKPKPVIPPLVDSLSTTYTENNKHICISWEVNESTPPQLTFYIEVRKEMKNGELKIGYNETSPHKRDIQLDVECLEPGLYHVSFEYYDIFNQKSNTKRSSFIV